MIFLETTLTEYEKSLLNRYLEKNSGSISLVYAIEKRNCVVLLTLIKFSLLEDFTSAKKNRIGITGIWGKKMMGTMNFGAHMVH